MGSCCNKWQNFDPISRKESQIRQACTSLGTTQNMLAKERDT